MMPGRLRVPRDLMTSFNDPKDREIQRFFAAIETRVNEANALKLGDIPTDFSDGAVYFAESGYTVTDVDEFFYDNANNRLSIGDPLTKTRTLNVNEDLFVNTGWGAPYPYPGDGIVIESSAVLAFGVPAPMIRGETAGGSSNLWVSKGGLILLQSAGDSVVPNPVLFFSDPAGDVFNNAAAITYTVADKDLTFGSPSNMFFNVDLPDGQFSIGGEINPQLAKMHITTNLMPQLALVSTQDSSIIHRSASEYFAVGIDHSDSQNYKVSYGGTLGTNDALVVDESADVTIVNNLKGLNRAKQYFFAGF